jgi:hypothetical protein
VSFDVFFQGFIAGLSSESGGSEMRRVLARHVTDRNGAFSACALATGRLTSTSATTG